MMRYCADHKDLIARVRRIEMLLYIAIGLGLINISAAAGVVG